MIHQFIFAGPKPGLSAEAFQSYWVNFHAVDYAAKIPQIRQYLVATRVPMAIPRAAPFFEGAAEIWLKDDAEQLASLQSPEFLDGARRDEPRWASFWRTFVLDTDPQLLTERSEQPPLPEFVKLYILLKRRPDLPVSSFRAQLIADRSSPAFLPAVQRHLVGLARDGLYGFGEPAFDAIEVLSFRDTAALETVLADASTAQTLNTRPYVHETYSFNFAGREHWVIRPGER